LRLLISDMRKQIDIGKKLILKYLLIILSLALLPMARAETVNLKNGNSFDGRIVKEDDEAVWLEFAVGVGKGETKILKSEIATIEADEPGILKINAPAAGASGESYSGESVAGEKKIKDSYLVRNSRYGFSIEIAPEFNLEVPPAFETDYTVSYRPPPAKKNHIVYLDVQAYAKKKKDEFVDIFKQPKADPFGYNLSFVRKDKETIAGFDSYLCVYDISSSGSIIHRYLFFPTAGSFGVNLTFTYPKSEDRQLRLKILDMAATASLANAPVRLVPSKKNLAPEAGFKIDKNNISISVILLVVAGLIYFMVSRKKKPADKQN